jgi:hypothetical protein
MGWMRVDQNQINQPLENRDPAASGVSLQVFVSPYDIPEAIHGGYDKGISRFVISFKYAGVEEESISKTTGNEHIDFFVGKDSNRLYRIAVDVDAMQATTVEVAVSSAIDRLAESPTRRTGNYIAAKRAIHQSRRQLEELAAAR